MRVCIVSCRDCCLSASDSNNIKWRAKIINLPIQFRIYCVHFLHFCKAEEWFISRQLWQGKCNQCLLDLQMNMLERLGVIIRKAECFDSFSFIIRPLAQYPLFWTKWNALKHTVLCSMHLFETCHWQIKTTLSYQMRPTIEGQRYILERVCLPFGFDVRSSIVDVKYGVVTGMLPCCTAPRLHSSNRLGTQRHSVTWRTEDEVPIGNTSWFVTTERLVVADHSDRVVFVSQGICSLHVCIENIIFIL